MLFSRHWLLKANNSIFLFEKSSLLTNRIQETAKIDYSVLIIYLPFGRENWNSQKVLTNTEISKIWCSGKKVLRGNLWFPARLFNPVPENTISLNFFHCRSLDSGFLSKSPANSYFVHWIANIFLILESKLWTWNYQNSRSGSNSAGTVGADCIDIPFCICKNLNTYHFAKLLVLRTFAFVIT